MTVKTQEEVLLDYNNKKVSTVTMNGIDTREWEDKELPNIVSSQRIVTPARLVTDIELKAKKELEEKLQQVITYVANYNRTHTSAERGAAWPEREKIVIEAELQEKYNTFSKDGKTYIYERIAAKLNHIFFNISKKDNTPYDNYESKFGVSDPDHKKWSYKTWVFTNVPTNKHTIHFMDRSNRPGLVQFKNNMQSLVFDALDIPKNSLGVFVIKDSVLARPEFHNIGYVPNRRHGNLEEIAKTSGRLYSPNISSPYGNDAAYSKEEYPPKITPMTQHTEDPMLEGYIYQDTKLGEDVREKIRNGLPYNSDYVSLFNGGFDTMYMDKVLRKQENTAIERWKTIVDALYNNRNMVIGNTSPSEYYFKFIRQYSGCVSNYVQKSPATISEIDLFRHTSTGTMDYASYIGPTNYKVNTVIEPGFKSTTEANMLMHVINKAPKLVELERVSTDLLTLTTRVDEFMTRKNDISLEDIIFIPIEKIEEEHGVYYDEQSDLTFVLQDYKMSSGVAHPYSKAALELKKSIEANTTQVANKGHVGTTLVIYNEKEAREDVIYYTKVLGEVVKVPVLPRDEQGRTNYITINKYTTDSQLKNVEEYPFTKETLESLDLYRTYSAADRYGYDRDLYEMRKNEFAYRELETKDKELVTKERINAIKLRTEEIKLEAEKEKFKFALQTKKIALTQLHNDDMFKLYAYKMKIYLEEVKLEIEQAKGKHALAGFEYDKYLATLNANTAKLKADIELATARLKLDQAKNSAQLAKWDNAIEGGHLLKDLSSLAGKLFS